MATRRAARSAVQSSPRGDAVAVPDSPPVAGPVDGARAWIARTWALPGALAVAALVLYLVRLGAPPGYSFDEVYHAYTATQYVEGNTDAYIWWTVVPEAGKPNPNVGYEWTHPPLGKWLIAGGVALLGDDPTGWRLSSALFGAVGVVLAFLLGLRLTGSRLVGALAAGLLLADGLYFVQSRTGMVDIFVLVFTLGALLACHAALTAPAGKTRRSLILTGLCLGLALATKWNAAYAALLIGLVLGGNALRLLGQALRDREARSERPAGRRHGAATTPNTPPPHRPTAPPPLISPAIREHLIWLPLALVVLPPAIYLLAYGPFFLAGYGWDGFVELQRQMWHYHNNLQAIHPYQSDWWQWPLAAKPVWYHVDYGGARPAFTYANVNPILAWAMVPAVLAVGWLWWRERRLVPLLILGIGFFGQWLPWALSPRLSFAYHFLPAVPFGALAVAVLVAAFWNRGGPPRYAAAAYLAAVALAFAFFYPIWSGVPLSPDQLELRYWFDSWR
jgi:dolichyl-phosphate-mannose-protein mannosyltransferase